MDKFVEIAQAGEGWEAIDAGRARFGYKRLADAVRRAGQLVEDPRSAATDWHFVDDFMQDAARLARQRAELAAAEAALAADTNAQIVELALNGLSNGDIAAALGISPARASQLVKDNAEWLWGDDDPDGEVQYVKVLLDRGWRAGRGRGSLPPAVHFAGRVFVRTGLAGMIEGQPWRYTHVPREMLEEESNG